MTDHVETPRRVLITGAEGAVGRRLTLALARHPERYAVLATDLRASLDPAPGVTYRTLDITDGASVDQVVAEHRPDTVVHLAAVVTPDPRQGRERAFAVDVLGTRHLLAACLAHGVKKFVYTSSGAAYGYHADNRPLLREEDPLRGNEVFAYAWHKRLVEELLAEHRASHPELSQLIFRVSTILGPGVSNQITALFERPVVLGLKGVDTPFCFVWDEDVVACLEAGVRDPERVGIYNLTGDGVMTLRELAHALGRRYVALPDTLVAAGLGALSSLKLGPYGPEQVLFLKHRPVLANDRLKDTFGYRPTHTTREALLAWKRAGER